MHTWRNLQKHLASHPGKPVKLVCLLIGCKLLFPMSRAVGQAITGTKSTHQRRFLLSTASFPCTVCKKAFRKRDALRRHKRTHALQKPVLLCPSQGCQAYFSTTFNLQHHIRKIHLQLLSHRCSFPGCSKSFAMRVSTFVEHG